MRTRIAACSPKRCSCRAVACGDRGVSCDMGRRPLVRRRWRHGSPFPACQGMPPPVPRAPRSPRQFRLRSRTPVVPSCPVNVPKVSRGCRAAVFDAHAAGAYGPAHGASVDSPPSPEMRRRGQSVPDTGASPRRLRNAVASRKRHLGVVSRKLRLPRPRRIPADCPVARSGRDGSRPTAPRRPQTAGNIHLAPRRHQKRMFSSLAAIALQRRLAPRHYRIAAPGDKPQNAPLAAPGRRGGSDGDLRSDPAPDEHHHASDHGLVAAGHCNVGPIRFQRAQNAPLALYDHQAH